MRISSTRNPTVAFLRTLDRAAARRDERLFLAEGVRLVGEAVDSGLRAAIALYDPDMLARSDAGRRLLEQIPQWAERCYEANQRILGAAGQTDSPAGILVALRALEPPPFASQVDARFGLILDGIVDPGNAGTILRTADAVGAGWIAATTGTVDLFAPKVVRAGMGAHFRLPLYPRLSWNDIVGGVSSMTFVATDARARDSMYDMTWPERTILVVGSEAQGLSDEARTSITQSVHIPMRRGVESLNAAVAASVMMYHILGPRIETAT
ncbi:MAG: RNA methyltransferase [Chloroflexota bacterium]